MVRYRRGFCLVLAAFFLVLAPIRSHAASLAVMATGTYAANCLLAACGVAGGAALLTALIGSWDDADTYELLGAAHRLGSYAQTIYDRARDGTEERKAYYQELEQTLLALMTAAWGDLVSGIRSLAAELKTFLQGCYGYGTAGTEWYVPAVPALQVWGETEWSSRDFYPLPTSPSYLVPFMVNNSDYTLFLTVYAKSVYSGVMNIQNWYYYNKFDLFGVYNAQSRILTTYQRNAAEQTYAEYPAYAYSVYVYEDGRLSSSIDSLSFWQRATLLCEPADAAALPFPVFSSLTDAEAYVATGEADNTYAAGTVPVGVDTFREDVAAGTVSDVFTFPVSAEQAAEAWNALESSYAEAGTADLEDRLKEAGLEVTITDVPAVPDDGVEEAPGLSGDLADVLEGILTMDPEEAEEQLSLPAILSRKFPFCIPFDLIHLVRVFAAEPEVPRFALPLTFDYQDFHYEEVFVVDMSDFDPVIRIFRLLEDLLFCAGLMVITRSLIRG